MGSVNWTNEQLLAIKEKSSNILVAAAAGSGKTAVLVERIINKIINDKMDIDKLLIVTFTNAAASEMRERILEAIYKKLEEFPEDNHLQNQILLLNKANISTIHSFCLNIIRNNFYNIELSPNFRIGDNLEIEILKQEVLEELFENLYEKNDENFLKLTEIYTGYKGDETLKEIIMSIYKYIQSSPFPIKWLNDNVEMFNIKNINTDFSLNLWGKILLEEIKDILINCIKETEKLIKEYREDIELDKFCNLLSEDLNNYNRMINSLQTWDNAYENISSIVFGRFPNIKNLEKEFKDILKDKRDNIKEKFKGIEKSFLLYKSVDANLDIKEMYPILTYIREIIVEFINKYKLKKKEKNIIDFNDIEHFTLELLLKEDENGKFLPTEIAEKYRNQFTEIAIDEYQDSNLVQEYILSTISNGSNIFMVGDVKQSIYKFRQARPELFLEKYDRYKLKEEKTNLDNLKIQLFKNFRSRSNVLEFTNLIFENIMSKELGDIEYTEKEYLNFSANFDKTDIKNIAGKVELNIIDTKEEIEDTDETIDGAEIEAKFVAKKIKNILTDNYYVFDKKVGYRKAEYKDFVILLRSAANLSPIYEKELQKLNLPVFSDASSGYLDTVEIETIISLLKIINNPSLDIELVTVLRSPIFNFTDEELVTIRLCDKKSNFYTAIQKAINIDENLKIKINYFFELINKLREKQEYLSLDEFLWQIYTETGYYDYVSLTLNGNIKTANLKILIERAKEYEKASFKGIFNFIKFMEKLKNSNNDLGSAKIIGENDNVIRIMSIHKSKGLEFPIVFLSSTGKNFNMQDLKQNILLHQDIGLGPKYVNYEKKLTYTTLAKEAIKIRLKKELLAEEMRVLYVALTRSKEKLIITGISKDLEKSLSKKEELLEIYKGDFNKINRFIVAKGLSYLDWIEFVMLKNKGFTDNVLETKYINKEEIILEEKDKEEIKNIKLKPSTKDSLEKIDKIFSWQYEFEAATKILSKTSVSKIKEEHLREDKQKLKMEYDIGRYSKKTGISAAERGSVIHFILQKINYKEKYSRAKLEELIEQLKKENLLNDEQIKSIDINIIENVLNSEFAKNLNEAKEIHKEVPFYLNLPANKLLNEDVNDKILIQGIIDLFFIDKNNKLILADYKTDYILENDEEKLVNKYKKQVELYKNALEKALNRKVDKTIIYSICLNKEIIIK